MYTLAALISSSAKHSAILLMFLKAASRAPGEKHKSRIRPGSIAQIHNLCLPVQSNQMA